MDPARLMHVLSLPEAYPHPAAPVEVRQTHISMVFLAGPFAYKVKKPVRLGFLDFSTLEKRRHFCEEEVRLNRRLAPAVYLGVVSITIHQDTIRIDGPGNVIDWAVKMQRLPDQASLQHRLLHGQVDESLVRTLAHRIAAFHRSAETKERIASFGRFDVVASNARENFTEARGHIDLTVSRVVFDRLQSLTETKLEQFRPLIEERARSGTIRDTHGDLRLDHVYLFPGKSPPDDMVVIDCIEFSECFRFADPVADMAFLCMDFIFHGRRDLARIFAGAYFTGAADGEGRELLAFYTAYRAIVRAKVEGLKLLEREVPAAEASAEKSKARAHWLLALHELEEPARKPCLLLVGGLPGTGKSTLARSLAEAAGFTIIRSDVVRKELAGLSPLQSSAAPFHHGLYLPEWTDRTYAECLARVEKILEQGGRVVVDAGCRQNEKRLLFLDAARRWGVPALFFHCQASAENVRRRLIARHGDASDADWAVYQRAAEEWQPPPATSPRRAWPVSTDGPPEVALAAVMEILRLEGLV